MQTVYRNLYDREAEVMAIHAGLETSVIGVKYPEFHMILGRVCKTISRPTNGGFAPQSQHLKRPNASLSGGFRRSLTHSKQFADTP
jgi:hypothetical protein